MNGSKVRTPVITVGPGDDRSWLQADIQPPEFEVRFTPKSGHSEARAGLPLLTQAVRKRFSRGRDEIMNQDVGLSRNNDSPTLPSGFNCCAIGLGARVFTQPGPEGDMTGNP